MDFLTEHYGTHDHHNQDEAEHHAHHKLPFGSHHTDDLKETFQPFLNVTGPIYPNFILLSLPVSHAFSLVEQWHSQFSPSIWQPPKLG
jgi:hypothetical protein